MSVEFETPNIEAPRTTRRDFLISLAGIVGGTCIAVVGFDGSNRSMDEDREFALRLAQASINSKDKGATGEDLEALRMEYVRRTFMRDRGYPALLFLGAFTALMGGVRLYLR